MAQIEVKFDHQLTQSPIVLPLNTPNPDDGVVDTIMGTNTPVRQTLLYGIRVPLVRVGDIVVDMHDIVYMRLSSRDVLPKLHLIINDTSGLIRGLQNPGSDNEVRIQILPRMEGAYKKIDLTFYITKYEADGEELEFYCAYKLPALYNSRIKCFGEVTTTEFFEMVAHECMLGLATNISESNDKRYLYCRNESLLSLMSEAINTSGEAGNNIQNKVLYDYWVDFWNNINIVDIYERWNTVDVHEDMMVYVAAEKTDVSQVGDEDGYMHVAAILTNNPAMATSELYVDHYDTINNSTQLSSGSDRVYTTYNIDDREALDYFLQDGDQKKDVFVKFEYVGENYGEFNYLMASRCRNMMLNKMNSEVIEVRVGSPLVSLMRGSKVDLLWYDTNPNIADKKRAMGIEEIETNISIPDSPDTNDYSSPQYRVNKQISGQYYVLSSVIEFENDKWSNTLRLTRPREGKQTYLDLSEETKQIS